MANSGRLLIAKHMDQSVMIGQSKTGSNNQNPSMKEGSLFCFVVMRFTELGCFRSCSKVVCFVL
jgi:hypothetical protein